MEPQSCGVLVQKRCVPCEGGVPKYARGDAEEQVKRLDGWTLNADATRIRKEWTAVDFTAAMQFFNAVAVVAEDENHHPDLHLERYRLVAVEIWTHAVGGLSENDFILAAKIDQLPIRLKPAKKA
ncbi:MAG: 4a-hydroxytetrahydrobiopterin dehydratase [Planctomycetia bacterium]